MIRTAGVACGAAAALLAWTAARALHVDPPVAPLLPEHAVAESLGAARRQLYPARRLLAAVDKDPFHPERRRPAERFQIPSGAPVVATRAAEPAVHVIGTAVGPNGGFAMCSWAGGKPRIVRVGDRLGDWTLSKVTPGAAEFTAATGTTMVVRVAKAGT